MKKMKESQKINTIEIFINLRLKKIVEKDKLKMNYKKQLCSLDKSGIKINRMQYKNKFLNIENGTRKFLLLNYAKNLITESGFFLCSLKTLL